MDLSKHIFISHQRQCDLSEIEKLVEYLEAAGFKVQHGDMSLKEFEEILYGIECYICILDQNSHQSKDLSREIISAAMAGKKVFAVYCPTVNVEIQLPQALDTCAIAVTEWNPPKLAEGLNGSDIGFSDQQGKENKTTRSTKPPKCK